MFPKAILAVVVAALGAFVVALGAGDTDFSDIDAKSWLITAIAVLGSGGMADGDDERRLHWAPLRDSLTREEASGLIDRLERYESNVGSAA